MDHMETIDSHQIMLRFTYSTAAKVPIILSVAAMSAADFMNSFFPESSDIGARGIHWLDIGGQCIARASEWLQHSPTQMPSNLN